MQKPTVSCYSRCSQPPSVSLLSALAALLTLASFVHIASSNHAAIVSLEELGRLVNRVELFALLGLLLIHDRLERLALSLLLDALSPLVANLTQLVLGVLAVILSFVLLLRLLAHFRVVRVQRFSILLVRTIVLGQEGSLGQTVLRLNPGEIVVEPHDLLFQLFHLSVVALLHGLLDLVSLSVQLVLPGVLLSA